MPFLTNVQSFHISKINYSKDKMIEIVPEHFQPELVKEINFIKDSVYYPLGTPLDVGLTTLDYVVSKEKPISVYHKNSGAIFTKEKIPNYHNKRQIKDTILFNKPYKRFEVNSPRSFTRFYVYETDTILPYSLYRHAEIDFKGRIERIDSYDKVKNIFVSLQPNNFILKPDEDVINIKFAPLLEDKF